MNIANKDTNGNELNSSESLYQMGNVCINKASAPCFRVAPQPIDDCTSQNQDHNAYCLPWEQKSKSQAKVSNNQPCCFCWCCLCTFTCKYSSKKTQPPAVADNFASSIIDVDSILMGEERITTDRLHQWKIDFESLIKDEAGKKLFQEFLQKEFSDENLLFWADVEKMKTVKDGASRYLTIRKIYKEYIQPRAKREINVEAWVRKAIDDKIEQPSVDIFDPAQTQVYLLMYRQSWPRFLTSKYYQRLVEIATLDPRDV